MKLLKNITDQVSLLTNWKNNSIVNYIQKWWSLKSIRYSWDPLVNSLVEVIFSTIEVVWKNLDKIETSLKELNAKVEKQEDFIEYMKNKKDIDLEK